MTEWYLVNPYELEGEAPCDEGYEATKKGQPLHSSNPEWMIGWEMPLMI